MTRAEQTALDAVRTAETRGFSGMFTGREMRLSVMLCLERKGFVRSEQMVVCDGDGFALEPERERLGWSLTAAGKRAVLAAPRT